MTCGHHKALKTKVRSAKKNGECFLIIVFSINLRKCHQQHEQHKYYTNLLAVFFFHLSLYPNNTHRYFFFACAWACARAIQNSCVCAIGFISVHDRAQQAHNVNDVKCLCCFDGERDATTTAHHNKHTYDKSEKVENEYKIESTCAIGRAHERRRRSRKNNMRSIWWTASKVFACVAEIAIGLY